VEQAAEAILITDASGKILYANPSFERITGYTVAEVIGKNPRILSSGQHDLTFYKGLWQTITKGNSWSGHFVNKKKDGSLYHEDATISPVRDSLGKIVNYVAVKKDVTSEWNLQQQLFQAQKMEAIGTLAGGIAHDFNNLLQVILGTTEIVLWGKSKDDPDRANMQAVYDAGKSGADLVKSLLAFSRQQPTELQAIDLNQEAVNVQKLLTRTIPKNIKIELRLSDDLDKISADATQVGQMLMNLAVNARDAMPDGGEITIETANVALDAEYCARNPGVTPGRYVSLTFSDTGSGMDPKTLENIYQPFFTTKPVGKGTGLGLATVYGIVMRHHGHIKCYSELGHGSTFKIYFPAIKKKDHRKSAEPVEDIRGGKEIVLLVEDDKIVGDLAARLLLDFGYNVIPAPNGEKALEIYRENWDRISLVVLDLLMPEMDGRECLAEILKINPLARAIVVSGYSADGTVDQLIKEGAKAFVHKPYDAMDLLQIIRDVLDG
ncbi:MAG: PAS domain S-box protein, partial [Desulfomonilaceae bacterium]